MKAKLTTADRLAELLEANRHAVIGGWACDERGLCFLLGKAASTLRAWRAAGQGPKCVLLGRWLYDLESVAAYCNTRPMKGAEKRQNPLEVAIGEGIPRKVKSAA